MYRCHPQTRKLVELIRDKAIGEVRLIQATFSFAANVHPSSASPTTTSPAAASSTSAATRCRWPA